MKQGKVIDKLKVPRLRHDFDAVFVCIFFNPVESPQLVFAKHVGTADSVDKLTEDPPLVVEHDGVVEDLQLVVAERFY